MHKCDTGCPAEDSAGHHFFNHFYKIQGIKRHIGAFAVCNAKSGTNPWFTHRKADWSSLEMHIFNIALRCKTYTQVLQYQ